MRQGSVRRYKWAVVTAAGLLLTIPALWLIQSRYVYRYYEEINVQTGQARYSRYVLSKKVSERIAETPLSRALAGETVHVTSIEPWHLVNQFTLGRAVSPYYTFHGALSEVRQFELLAEMLEMSPEQKRDTAQKILTLWQQAGRVAGSTEYMASLLEESA